ncbi:SPX domain-containing protein [Crepidotus variabilis]|uniref:SPX domain-containing protein n=1 Tax=Crepidotus variabilis TaxID=179855 RepID=A0A9P6JNJ3_9AGAR|nr:SPX domain-containing protein [Crepidotus variabilis]
MHFGKTYSQLLLSLPPELRDNAIQYRQLKKVIRQIVDELNSLGLQPEVLHEYIESSVGTPELQNHSTETLELEGGGPSPFTGRSQALNFNPDHAEGSTRANGLGNRSASTSPPPKVVYELNEDAKSGKIEPQLRVWLTVPNSPPMLSLGSVKGKEKEPLENGQVVEEYTDNSTQESVDGTETSTSEEEGDVIGGREQIHGRTTNNMTPSLLYALQRGLPGSHNSLEPENGSVSPTSIPEQDKYNHDTLVAENPSVHSRPSPLSLSPESSTITRELIIPLVHDTEFFNILSTTLEGVSTHMETLHSEFEGSIKDLAKTIGDTSHPASVVAHFQPYSRLADDAGAVRVKRSHLKNDLYAWREIFQLYVESEVFESVSETHHGECSIEESEKRLQQFAQRVTTRGLGDGREFKLKQSIDALQTFLDLNLFILNIKKFAQANTEATRKILKKHAKRTALPLPTLQTSSNVDLSDTIQRLHITDPRHPNHPQQPLLTLIAKSSASSLPRMLVQAIGETLLPIIPSLDDYSCLICTSLAFKPIRLSCGHLFCVRCLVKMQKRGKGDCPMCRSPSVLIANRENVDWSLMNFMQDWFPEEARDKLKSNEKEAAAEQMEEYGIDPNQPCIVM